LLKTVEVFDILQMVSTTEAEKAFKRWSYRYWEQRAKGF